VDRQGCFVAAAPMPLASHVASNSTWLDHSATGRCEWPVDERPRHQQPPPEPYEVASRPAAPAQCDAASARRSLAWLAAWLAAWLPSRRLAARTNKQGQGNFLPPSSPAWAAAVSGHSRSWRGVSGRRVIDRRPTLRKDIGNGM